MKYFKYIAMLIVSIVVVSCGDVNTLEWSTNKATSEAKTDELDFAFIDGNCQHVIEMLEPKQDFLTDSELYQYSNAVMACAGFDLLNTLSSILNEKEISDDPYAMIQSFMGISVVNINEIENKENEYEKVLSKCDNGVSNEMKVLCGVAAAADIILKISQVALTLSEEESIEITEIGMEEIIKGKTLDKIHNAVTDSEVDIDTINENIEIVSTSADVIEYMVGNSIDFSEELDKFIVEISDSSGRVTERSLSNYIFNQFGDGNTLSYFKFKLMRNL